VSGSVVDCSFPSFITEKCELVTTVSGQIGRQIQLMLSTKECNDGAMEVTVEAWQPQARDLLLVVVDGENGHVYDDPYCHFPPNVQQLKRQGETYKATFALYPFNRLYVLESRKFDGKMSGPICRCDSLAAFEFVRRSRSRSKDFWRQIGEEDLTPSFVFGQELDGHWRLVKGVPSMEEGVDVLYASYHGLVSGRLPILAAGKDGQGNLSFLTIRDGEVVRLWYPKNFRKIWYVFLAFERRPGVESHSRWDQTTEGVQSIQWCVDTSHPLVAKVQESLIRDERFPSLTLGAPAIHTFSIWDRQGGEMVDVRLSAQESVLSGMQQVQIQTSRAARSLLFAVVTPGSSGPVIYNCVDNEGFFPPNSRQVENVNGTYQTTVNMFPGDRLYVMDCDQFKGDADPTKRYEFSPLAAFKLISHVGSGKRVNWRRKNASRRERYLFSVYGRSDWRNLGSMVGTKGVSNPFIY